MALADVLPGVDATAALVDQVRAACAARTPLRIVGGDTKRFYGREVVGQTLAVGGHHGVLRYDPAELVLTARAGTPLADVESLLARHGQRLPFEPPAFAGGATIGGTVAAGLAGPARALHGPVRDYVLGAQLLTGDGRVLRFGGEVMKNVAGYDVSRLLAGSLGILGVLLEISLKVLPLPAGTLTVRRSIGAAAAVERLAAARQRGLPVSASFWCDGELHVRLDGSATGLGTIAPEFGGDPLPHDAAQAFWRSVREHEHPVFATAAPLWRLTLPITATAAALEAAPAAAFEWNGAQVWVAGCERGRMEGIARATGGGLTLFRVAPDDHGASGIDGEVFSPLPPSLLQLHRAVKRVFDPAGILNPGRMYAGL